MVPDEVIEIESSINDRLVQITREDGVIEIVSDMDEMVDPSNRVRYPSSPSIRCNQIVELNSEVTHDCMSIELDANFQQDTSLNDSELEVLRGRHSTKRINMDNEDNKIDSLGSFPSEPNIQDTLQKTVEVDTAKKAPVKQKDNDVLRDILSDIEDRLSSHDTIDSSSLRSPEQLPALTARWTQVSNRSVTAIDTGNSGTACTGNNTIRRKLANKNSAVSILPVQSPPKRNLVSTIIPTSTDVNRERISIRPAPRQREIAKDTIEHRKGGKLPMLRPNRRNWHEMMVSSNLPSSADDNHSKRHKPVEIGSKRRGSITDNTTEESVRAIPDEDNIYGFEKIDTDSSFDVNVLTSPPHPKQKPPKLPEAPPAGKEYIVHGKYYSNEESKSMVTKSHASNSLKKKFTEVNKTQRDKEVLLSEIIISINDAVNEQLIEGGSNVNDIFSPSTIFQNYEDIPIIRLKRKCSSIYDFNHNMFYPCDTVICEEPTCVLLFQALDFFHKYSTQKAELMEQIEKLVKSGKKAIIILNEYSRLEKSLSHLEDKDLRDKVAEQLSGSTSPKRRTAKQQELEKLGLTSKDLGNIVNEIVLHWQVEVFPLNSITEFITWFKNLVWVVSKIRYDPMMKNISWSHINLKIGKTPTEVLSKTLQQINSVTEIRANRVTNVYKSFQMLLEDLKKGYLVAGNDDNPLMSRVTEKVVNRLFLSNNPDEKVYF
ncbi:HBL155Wp [Eremothecium sinecaudum]|uniref:HBL155Wp n=1 Tax=Eremothecium sinecaudum TaxID=45286 RepID=A0A109UWR7_9SACH|nr:HBL155Wp [Eremothecium sinecaudum]AMD18747.1 HBL155Wp [Eremothecium sinecaudum]